MTADRISCAIERLTPDGRTAVASRELPVEMAMAIEINGIGYAVMMATPCDLGDYAAGFLLSEQLIDTPAAIAALDCACVTAPSGTPAMLLRLTVPGLDPERLLSRVRNRAGESSCGHCGIESLDQALPMLPQLPDSAPPEPAAIFTALASLRDHQPLNSATGGAHAAACCDASGAIRLVREDVGRHNAFDKLIGAMAIAGIDDDRGFVLLSSRCSYELVEKAVRARIACLVTISTATSLAVDRARQAGLNLIILARSDAVLAVPKD